MNKKAWLDKPKSLTEKGYRKHMAKVKDVTVRGHEFTFQGVSPRWYYGLSDRHLVKGKRNTAEYVNELIQNVVIKPVEVRAEGVESEIFADDIGLIEDVVEAIESFLKG